MESLSVTLLAIVFCFSASNPVFFGNAVVTPNYTVVHKELDYEVRLYTKVSWISALARGTSFQKSTKDGFHRIYQYIHGLNFNSSQLELTAPVLTSISKTSTGTQYCTMVFLSKRNPPQPNPELNLQLIKWKSKCVAVRMFSGFADDDSSKREMEALATSLGKHSTQNTAVVDNINTSSYIVAQYKSSRQLERRLNEIWIDVSGYNIEGCVPVE